MQASKTGLGLTRSPGDSRLARRSVDTFIRMQEEFLKIAGKQTHTWVEAAKSGKPYEAEPLLGLAKEGMENS